ncbi:MAG: alkaline phosphatase family protein [Deltaproteobacteria bacterium]|nr:alkaline phosphatase family protein [Deltaproteobacteria bacterium]
MTPRQLPALACLVLVLFASGCATTRPSVVAGPNAKVKKLYWFIPDGMRADRGEFNIYRWAAEGKLPNIKRMMEEGAHGYSIPDFPSHTPINFASLLTGAHPSKHGIADGPMHALGFPLAKPSAPGFASTTKRVPPIWKTMEAAGKKIMLLSIPGSTPPEIRETTVRGRWGGWGADTFNMIFESKGKLPERRKMGRGFRLFFLDAPLTKFVDEKLELDAHGLTIKARVLDGRRMEFSLEDGRPLATLAQGQWSDWRDVELRMRNVAFPSAVKIKLIKLWPDGNFRVRVLYNNLNRLITEPGHVAETLSRGVGPMVDHADNWPPQLIFENEDKQAFLDEMRLSLDWHRRAVPFIYERFNPDVFIHDTYTSKQMLESRWWQGEIDASRKNHTAEKSAEAWKDILELYQGLDAIVGEAMKKAEAPGANKDTLVVLSSDHGVCPLHRLVHLNNLFAKKGWLKFKLDPATGEATIDWAHTKVIYLKMLHVYINPAGLAGNYQRASGPEYEKLRDEVVRAVKALKDTNGVHPLVRAVRWEDAASVYDLPQDRIGDLVLETRVKYFWYEEVDGSGRFFSTPLTSGYKQSLDARINTCMWTPFLMWGPGVKKGYELAEPISHVDQLPTFLKLMDIPAPAHVQGRVLSEALE